MAKRFTDSNKWDHAWFRKLSPEMKCVWIFLCDKCDHAGIWIVDFESLNFHVGTKEVDEFLIFQQFGDKIEKLDSDKYLIRSFIQFQYGTLNPQNRVHQSVLSRLKKVAPNKDLISTLEGAKDKDKDKDKEKDKEPDWNYEAETCLQAVRLHTSDYAALEFLGPSRLAYVTHIGGISFIRKLKQEDSWTVKRLRDLIKNAWENIEAAKESA